MFSYRRIAGARVNPPDTENGNGIARSFSEHNDPTEPIVFIHNQNGKPIIVVIESNTGIEVTSSPGDGYIPPEETDTIAYYHYVDNQTVHVFTSLEEGIISIA